MLGTRALSCKDYISTFWGGDKKKMKDDLRNGPLLGHLAKPLATNKAATYRQPPGTHTLSRGDDGGIHSIPAQQDKCAWTAVKRSFFQYTQSRTRETSNQASGPTRSPSTGRGLHVGRCR